MSTDRDAEQLMDALVQGVGGQMPRGKTWNLDKALEPLLPVVDQIATDRAATALEAAAGELIRLSAGSGYNVWYASWLRDRAAALRADALDPS